MKLHTRQNKSGPVYYVDYYDVHGIRRQKTLKGVTSKREAESIAAQLRGELERQKAGIARYTAKSALTVSDAIALAARRPGLADSTRNRYRQVANKVEPIIGRLLVDRVGVADAERYIGARMSQGCGAAGINKETGIIHASLMAAFERGLSGSPPPKFPKLPETKHEKRALTKDESAALLDAAKRHSEEAFEIIYTMMALGVRPAEMWRMRWQDLDFDRKAVGVMTKKRGAGDSFELHWMPMSEGLDAVLEARAKRLKRKKSLVFGVMPRERDQGRRRNPDIKAPVGHEKGGESLEPYYMKRRLKAIARDAGIVWYKSVSYYTLRHTFATRVAENAPLHLASKLMRHKSLQMTMHYVHSDKDALNQAVSAVLPSPLPRENGEKREG